MLLIHCPWCGPREEIEFRGGGEAHLSRVVAGDGADDSRFADYLFMRTNPKGWHRERWCHSAGCRRWFYALRHTTTHRIHATYRPGDPPPEPPKDAP